MGFDQFLVFPFKESFETTEHRSGLCSFTSVDTILDSSKDFTEYSELRETWSWPCSHCSSIQTSISTYCKVQENGDQDLLGQIPQRKASSGHSVHILGPYCSSSPWSIWTDIYALGSWLLFFAEDTSCPQRKFLFLRVIPAPLGTAKDVAPKGGLWEGWKHFQQQHGLIGWREVSLKWRRVDLD